MGLEESKATIVVLRQRMQGYLAALEERGLSLDRRSIRLVEGVCTEKGGQDSFRAIWKLRRRPTAIITMSDILAIGVVNAAKEAGLDLPAELSVVGYDDIPMAGLVNPPITTVAQPRCRKGKQAAELLLQFINGSPDLTHHVLPTELVVRKSVVAPAARCEKVDAVA